MKAKVVDSDKITYTMSRKNAVQLRMSAIRSIEFLELKGLEDTDHYKKAVTFLEEIDGAFQ